MSFLHPILLGLGAACVAIPLVIHLLMRRRRKPVRWAAMRFLLEAQRQRHRRVRLEQLLLLLTRCLLVALVALAIARPILGPNDGARAGPREVYLLVDNSLTSAAIGDADETDLQRSLVRVRELLGSLDPARGDRAALITLAAPAQAVVSPPTSDLGVIERRLADLRPADSRLDLAGAIGLLPPMPSGDDAPGITVAVYSAFREGSLGHGAPHGPLPAGATLTATPPAETALGNTAIASFELLRPVVIASPDDAVTGLSQARATLTRWGDGLDAAALTALRVVTERSGASRELGAAVVRWSPGQREAQATVDLDLAGLGQVGRCILRAEIDRDANDRDNTSLALLEVRERFRVALVGARRFGARPRLDDFGPSDWLRLAARADRRPRRSDRGRDPRRRPARRGRPRRLRRRRRRRAGPRPAGGLGRARRVPRPRGRGPPHRRPEPGRPALARAGPRRARPAMGVRPRPHRHPRGCARAHRPAPGHPSPRRRRPSLVHPRRADSPRRDRHRPARPGRIARRRRPLAA